MAYYAALTHTYSSSITGLQTCILLGHFASKLITSFYPECRHS